MGATFGKVWAVVSCNARIALNTTAILCLCQYIICILEMAGEREV